MEREHIPPPGSREPGAAVKFIACVIALSVVNATAEPVFTLLDSGDPANRIDMVILGDGFTADEQEAFHEHAKELETRMFADPPFSDYRPFFNVHAVEVVSNESGADHPELEQEVDTALGARYACEGIQRLICVDHDAVEDALGRSVDPAARDLVLILVNDPEFGGSGGAYAVFSLGGNPERLAEVMLHEIGHAFAALADEYWIADDAPEREVYGGCEEVEEPPQANVTAETAREDIKWNTGGGPPLGWIEQDTEVPTAVKVSEAGDPGSEVGLYEGALFCPTGFYRPTPKSKMRSLFRPWDAVNEAEIIKAVYGSVALIESVDIDLEDGPPMVVADIVRPEPDTTEVTWTLDGTVVATDDRLDFAQTKPGEYALELTVADRTLKVRHDPDDLLSDVRTFALDIKDGDSDGLPDWWEEAHGLDSDNQDDATEDPDNDGLTSVQEFEIGTRPRNSDTDGDGASDGEEVVEGYDPKDADAYPTWARPSIARKLPWLQEYQR